MEPETGGRVTDWQVDGRKEGGTLIDWQVDGKREDGPAIGFSFLPNFIPLYPNGTCHNRLGFWSLLILFLPLYFRLK